MQENSTNNCEEMTQKYTNNRIQKKPNDFGLKYRNQKKKHNEKNQMNKEYDKRSAQRRLERGNTHRFTHVDTNKYQTGKRPVIWNIWFRVQEIHLQSRQISTRNEQMPTRSARIRMNDHGPHITTDP